jgi:hypothetical protein
MSAIRELIEAVEAGAWDALPHYGPEVWQPVEAVFGEGNSEPVFLAYGSSLDAARALHEAVLPGWRVQTLHQFESGHWHAAIYEPKGDDWPKWTSYPACEAVNEAPARAWLLAILKALAARETDG